MAGPQHLRRRPPGPDWQPTSPAWHPCTFPDCSHSAVPVQPLRGPSSFMLLLSFPQDTDEAGDNLGHEGEISEQRGEGEEKRRSL